MRKIITQTELTERIALLEIRQKEEAILVKEQFKLTYESLTPLNILKNTIKDLVASPDLKGDLLSSAISIGAGHLGKKAIIGDASNPIKQVLGTFLQMAITRLVAKKGPAIGNSILGFLKTFIEKGERPDEARS